MFTSIVLSGTLPRWRRNAIAIAKFLTPMRSWNNSSDIVVDGVGTRDGVPDVTRGDLLEDAQSQTRPCSCVRGTRYDPTWSDLSAANDTLRLLPVAIKRLVEKMLFVRVGT